MHKLVFLLLGLWLSVSPVMAAFIDAPYLTVGTDSVLGRYRSIATGNNVFPTDGGVRSSYTLQTLPHTSSSSTPVNLVSGSNTVQFFSASGGAVTVNLPAASSNTDKHFVLKKTDSSANTVTVTPNGSDVIDGAGTYVLSHQYDTVEIQSDGTNWFECALITPAAGGSGTVSSSTTGQVAVYTGATTVGGSANFTASSGAITAGSSGNAGSYVMNGATSGTGTINVPAIAGSTTFTLPGSNGATNIAQAFYQYLQGNGGVTSWLAPTLYDMVLQPNGLIGFTSNSYTVTPDNSNSSILATTNVVDCVCTGSDGNVWYSTATTKLGRITISNYVNSTAVDTEISTTSNTRYVTPGSDGNVWYSTTTTKVGKMTTGVSPTNTEYSTTTSTNGGGICSGPDGNMWYGTGTGDKIGKISTTGSGDTEYTTTHNTKAICVGADGRIWYATGAAFIGAVTTGGIVTEYATTSNCYSVCLGSDGNVWYATDTTKIGKVTPTGTDTEYNTTTATYAVCSGADGYVWYSTDTTKLGRITTLGLTDTEYTTGEPTSSLEICAGPDGSIWYGAAAAYIGYEGLDITTNSVNAQTLDSININGDFTSAGYLTAKSFLDVSQIQGCRLSSSSVAGVPADNTGATILYLTPQIGAVIGLYSSLGWLIDEVPTSPPSISVPATTNTIYDVYAYDNSGVVTLGTAVWSSGVMGSEYTLPTTTPLSICMGADGNLWYCDSFNDIGTVTLAGIVTNYTVSGAGFNGPGAICAGPDGNIWFCDSFNSKIGKITPSGTSTEFSTTTGSAYPSSICVGPDGDLWFTEYAISKIGRMTTAGTMVSETATTTASAVPEGICVGSDGNVWFGEQKASLCKIGKITAALAVSEFSTGLTPTGGPQGLCLGSDGNVWFAEVNGSTVGKITTAGVITEYATTTSNPSALCAGPDGNLWIALAGGSNGKVGKITTSGAETEYTPTTGSTISDICQGPDGNLWFIESGTAGKVGSTSSYSPPTRGLQDGVVYTNNSTVDRLIGCIMTGNTSGQVPDTAFQRFLWNFNNQIDRPVSCAIPVSTWTTNTSVWRNSDANSAVGQGCLQILNGANLASNSSPGVAVPYTYSAPMSLTFTQSVASASLTNQGANVANGISQGYSFFPQWVKNTGGSASTSGSSTISQFNGTNVVVADPVLFSGLNNFQMREITSAITWTFSGGYLYNSVPILFTTTTMTHPTNSQMTGHVRM